MKPKRLASSTFFFIFYFVCWFHVIERHYINDHQRSSQSSGNIFADSRPTTNWQQQFTSLFYYLSNYNRLFLLISFLISLFSCFFPWSMLLMMKAMFQIWKWFFVCVPLQSNLDAFFALFIVYGSRLFSFGIRIAMETLGFNITQAEYINIQLLPKLSNVRDKAVTMLLKWLHFFFSSFIFFFSEYCDSGVNCMGQQFETVWTVIHQFPTEYVYLISQAVITVDFDSMFVYYVRYSGPERREIKKQFQPNEKPKNLSNLDFLCAFFLLCDCCFLIWCSLYCIIFRLWCM